MRLIAEMSYYSIRTYDLSWGDFSTIYKNKYSFVQLSS